MSRFANLLLLTKAPLRALCRMSFRRSETLKRVDASEPEALKHRHVLRSSRLEDLDLNHL